MVSSVNIKINRKTLWIFIMLLLVTGIFMADEAQNDATNSRIRREIISKKSDKLLVCYYSIPTDMNSSRGLDPSKINTKMCTHIIVGFGSVVNNFLTIDNSLEIYTRIADLKKLEPTLKVMISVGGINEPINTGFPKMVESQSNRIIFIKSVLKSLEQYNMDGIDIDWEYPVWFSENKSEKTNFVMLLEELKNYLENSGKKFILSAAVAAPFTMINKCYDVVNIAKYVDFINLMTYDYNYYRKNFPFTGHNSPLFNGNLNLPFLRKMNINYSANYWIDQGMPRNKIVVGIPTFGHSFKLLHWRFHGLYSPTKGIGKIGSEGFVDFSMICDFINEGGKIVYNSKIKAPYVFKDDEWISYSNEISVTEESKWIVENDFKGAMIFSLNTDDWNATCDGKTKFPLTTIVSRILIEGIV